jgi:hypothetical protein
MLSTLGCHPDEWFVSFLYHCVFCVTFNKVVLKMRTSSMYPTKRMSYVEHIPAALGISLPPNTKDFVQSAAITVDAYSVSSE